MRPVDADEAKRIAREYLTDPYLTKWRKWQQKQRERLEALKDGEDCSI